MGFRIPENELHISFSRSSGKGGQNVNKVSTKALLKWKPSESQALPKDVIKRFEAKYSSRINSEGEVVLQSDRFRSQSQNEEDCRAKLYEMIRSVETPPKKRKKTKPSLAQKRKRLELKKRQSEKKKDRRKEF